MPYCANCGTQAQSDQKFCSVCGTPSLSMARGLSSQPYISTDAEASTRTVRIAHFWWRVLSFTMDSILLGLIVAVPLRLSHQSFYLSAIIQTLAAFFYGALFIGYGNGQTLGMRVVRVRCVRAEDRGKVEPSRAFRRAFCYGALLLIGSLYQLHVTQNPTNQQSIENGKQGLIYFSLVIPHYLDLLWVAWDKQNQTLHDKFARTIVLREPKVVS